MHLKARKWLERDGAVPSWVEYQLPSLTALLEEVREERDAEVWRVADALLVEMYEPLWPNLTPEDLLSEFLRRLGRE